MTTDNVRVPRGQLPPTASNVIEHAFDLGWLLASKWTERDDLPSDMDSPAYQRDRATALAFLAAPAPAGSRKSREELLADLNAARQRAIDARIEFRTPEEIRAEIERNRSATPQPEQGAGLANAVYATVREALACDCNDTEDQVCDKCQALTAIIDLEERALARQQSRVVDADTLHRWRSLIDTEPSAVQKEITAALEGGRDGR